MRQGHFVLLFAMLLCCCIVAVETEKYQYQNAKEEQEKMEHAVRQALSSAAACLANEWTYSEKTSVLLAEQAFFETLAAELGTFETEEEEQVELCVPVFAVLGAEGIYADCLLEQTGMEERKLTQRVWKECASYEELCELVSQVVNSCNESRGAVGLDYAPALPGLSEICMNSKEKPAVFALFQGWSVAEEGLNFCESFVEAVGYIRQAEEYIVEVPVSAAQPYAVYHRNACAYVGSFGGVLERMTRERAVRVYGAFGCPYCVSQDESVRPAELVKETKVSE